MVVLRTELTLGKLVGIHSRTHLLQDLGGFGISLASGQTQPFDSLNQIGLRPTAHEQHQPDIGLSAGMGLLRSSQKPGERLLVIARKPEAVVIPFAQIILRIGIALFSACDRALPGEGPGAVGPLQSGQYFPE
jgi:hypothetical protein